MVKVLILIKTARGHAGSVLGTLREQAVVQEAYRVRGEYDIVVKLKLRSLRQLRDFVTSNLDDVQGVQKSTTMQIVE